MYSLQMCGALRERQRRRAMRALIIHVCKRRIMATNWESRSILLFVSSAAVRQLKTADLEYWCQTFRGSSPYNLE